MSDDLPADDIFPNGLLRITAASSIVAVGNPLACARHCIEAIEAADDSHLILLPELALGGYTCGDLFATASFVDACSEALQQVCEATRRRGRFVVVGTPVVVEGAMMNAAAVIARGELLGMVPKQYPPNYREFYELRHFRAGDGSEPKTISWAGRDVVPFGIDLLFQWRDAVIGIEICEDLWVPVPPSSLMALGGANVLLNLSASNETIGKASWRRELVLSQSGRCLAAYAYSSSGPTESSTDLVFGGHCLVAENGKLLGQSRHVGDANDPDVIGVTSVTAEVDLQQLAHDRRVTGTFWLGRNLLQRTFRRIPVPIPADEIDSPRRYIDGCPFVPRDPNTLDRRCAEILSIQAAGFAKRVSRLPADDPLVIGVSGGLDSTLALLVAIRACDTAGIARSRIHGFSLPGFGTTADTRGNAEELMRLLGITAGRIDIRQHALDTFLAMGHRPLGIELAEDETVESLQAKLYRTADDAKDLVFENVQARLRTFLLMSHGFAIGTGDLSEQALGWSTYNADHMSMYNVNTSIPKTLVRFLVRHVAMHLSEPDVQQVLLRIVDTPISPELLPPGEDGRIRQSTEAALGAYELHDFFLFHFIRHGASRAKIRYLADHADFEGRHTAEEIDAALETFFARFFANQYKRSCVPDGPKVGTVSLSPRGDWRMPSDADRGAF